MPAAKTKKTTRKSKRRSTSAAAAPAAASTVTVRKRRRRDTHSGEIVAICAVAASVLLGIFLYTDSGGGVGLVVDGIFKGLFGFGALFIPVAAAWLGISMILRRFEAPHADEAGLVTGLFVCICTMAHAVSNADYSAVEGVTVMMAAAYSKGAVGNGGMLGALLGELMKNALGVAGTYIAVVAAAIVFIILLTDRSFIQGILFGINKAKSLRRPRVYAEEDDRRGEPPAGKDKPGHPARDPKKATLTFGEQSGADAARPKILLFNEHEEDKQKGRKGRKPAVVQHAVPGVITIGGQQQAGVETETDSHAQVAAPETFASEPVTASEAALAAAYAEADEPEITTLYRAAFDDTGVWNEAELPFDGYGYDSREAAEQEEYYVDTSPKSDIDKLKERLMDEAKIDSKTRRSTGGAASDDIGVFTQQPPGEYIFPPVELLNRSPETPGAKSRAQIFENSRKLEDTLKSFGVEAKVIEVSKGPTVTRYELSPGQGVKVSRIAGLADDLALNLAAVGIRIEAPIPGKAAVGIEIPNKEVTTVYLREVIDDDLFARFPSKLAFALGKDIAGNTVVADIARMPHLLIAGATGSGKSVCVNTLITSLLYKADPSEVKLVMIDPKVVELGVYNGIPHLLIPVVTEPKKAAGALNWAVQEMVTRYNLFAEASVRDLKGYNTLLRNRGETALPQIVIIIDELADLMMVAPGEVEEAICRLAQMARAAGLHLIIATQRPSVDVITGLIKANIPSRLAFAVSSGIDSRTILDSVGAEKLLGKGDMLFYPVGVSKPQRVQGAFITDKEVENIVAFVKNNYASDYDQEMINKITSAKNASGGGTGEVDELFLYAAEFVIEKDKASASMLQRQFRIGYNKAARLIEELEARGVVGQEDGSKPRKVLMNSYQWGEYKETLL